MDLIFKKFRGLPIFWLKNQMQRYYDRVKIRFSL